MIFATGAGAPGSTRFGRAPIAAARSDGRVAVGAQRVGPRRPGAVFRRVAPTRILALSLPMHVLRRHLLLLLVGTTACSMVHRHPLHPDALDAALTPASTTAKVALVLVALPAASRRSRRISSPSCTQWPRSTTRGTTPPTCSVDPARREHLAQGPVRAGRSPRDPGGVRRGLVRALAVADRIEPWRGGWGREVRRRVPAARVAPRLRLRAPREPAGSGTPSSPTSSRTTPWCSPSPCR